ncbi:MAG: DUF547 domain-containing protein [Desulfobacterales bacterium]|nr:DUF547 domain-containing protein [Desulfobacterales bacterium]
MIIMTIWVCILFFWVMSNPVYSGRIDHQIFSQLLEQHVKGGIVDYRGFKAKEFLLDGYLDVLQGADSNNLSREDRLAFYINAYNAWTIKLILSEYPDVKSIKDLGSIFKSPWEKKICKIDEKKLSLDEIEHDIIRPQFKDPRIHFAVNCAALSCPPLLSEPYQGHIISRQLDHSTRAFINDPERNYIKDNSLYLSKIFKWYAEDFPNDIIEYILKYAEGNFKSEIEGKREKLYIKYLYYDWALNGN